MEFLIILAILGIFIFLYLKVDDDSSFSFDETSVSFYKKNTKTINFENIIKIERDYRNTYQGKTMYFRYNIHYKNENGDKKKISFYKSLTDSKKWEAFKTELLLKNPYAKISESIL